MQTDQKLVTNEEADVLVRLVKTSTQLIAFHRPDIAQAIADGHVQATVSLGVPTGNVLVRIRETGERDFKELFKVVMGDASGRAN